MRGRRADQALLVRGRAPRVGVREVIHRVVVHRDPVKVGVGREDQRRAARPPPDELGCQQILVHSSQRTEWTDPPPA
jgi:hypothetical protein